jgi:hypothetical protein
MSSQLHALAALTTWQVARRVPEPIWTLWRRDKSCLCQNPTPEVQPVGRRYSDWDNPPLFLQGSTRPIMDMNIRKFPEVKRVRHLIDFTAICEPITRNMCEPWRFTTLWAFMVCYRDGFTFISLPVYVRCWVWARQVLPESVKRTGKCIKTLQ